MFAGSKQMNAYLLAQYIAWQMHTMYHAALANAHLCGNGSATVDPAVIADEAERIRLSCSITGGPHSVDEMARCTDATVAWCARKFGMVKGS